VTDRVETLENYRLLAENASDIVYEVDVTAVEVDVASGQTSAGA